MLIIFKWQTLNKVGGIGKVLNVQSGQIVSNFYNFMKEESDTGVTIPMKTATEREDDAAMVNGTSLRTTSRIN